MFCTYKEHLTKTIKYVTEDFVNLLFLPRQEYIIETVNGNGLLSADVFHYYVKKNTIITKHL